MKNIAFVSNDKPHIFASKISALFKMKEDISQNLVNQCQYQIKSDVKDEDIDIFINYLLNDEVPKIITNGFRLLSSEILKEDNFTLIKQLNDPDVEDKTNIIKEISEKLDNILLFYGEELLKCPIQILRLIFDGANLKNHEFAYQLIVSHADKTQNNDIFILLPYINISKLQKNSSIECITKRKERGNWMPSFTPSFFENIENNQKDVMKKVDEINFDNENKYREILEQLNMVKQSISEQNELIEIQKKKITDLENENKNKEIMEQLNMLKQSISEQKELIEIQKKKITDLENENKNISQKLQQIESKSNDQKLKCASKLTISGNQIKMVNDSGNELSAITIPSIIESYNFGSNAGHIKFNNRFTIQWGRFTPSNWCGYNAVINFPIPFTSKPFLAATGGSGADYHPCAEGVTNTCFKTGWDHQQPTTWIAIGNI